MKGWVSLHRDIRQSIVWQDIELYRLWSLCLLKASHKKHKQKVGNQIVDLKPGQFVTGRDSLTEEYNEGLKKKQKISVSKLWRFIKLLESNSSLNIKSTTKYSVITVINWHEYQQNEQQIEQQLNSKRTATEQQVNTNNNDNNDNKKDSPARTAYDDDSPYMKMTNYFLEKIREWKPDYIFRGKKQAWADDFRKIAELDKRDKRTIQQVIDWTTSNSFWQANILSPEKLRKQFDTLQAQMNNEKQKVVSFEDKREKSRQEIADRKVALNQWIDAAGGKAPGEKNYYLFEKWLQRGAKKDELSNYVSQC